MQFYNELFEHYITNTEHIIMYTYRDTLLISNLKHSNLSYVSLHMNFFLIIVFLFLSCIFCFFLLENKNTGIVFGAILGAILGASLLSLVGYLLCGQRKTDSFSHRRLYDDRNEPGINFFQTITNMQ